MATKRSELSHSELLLCLPSLCSWHCQCRLRRDRRPRHNVQHMLVVIRSIAGLKGETQRLKGHWLGRRFPEAFGAQCRSTCGAKLDLCC